MLFTWCATRWWNIFISIGFNYIRCNSIHLSLINIYIYIYIYIFVNLSNNLNYIFKVITIDDSSFSYVSLSMVFDLQCNRSYCSRVKNCWMQVHYYYMRIDLFVRGILKFYHLLLFKAIVGGHFLFIGLLSISLFSQYL